MVELLGAWVAGLVGVADKLNKAKKIKAKQSKAKGAKQSKAAQSKTK